MLAYPSRSSKCVPTRSVLATIVSVGFTAYSPGLVCISPPSVKTVVAVR